MMNNFCYWHLVPFYTNCELKFKLPSKFESKRGWILRDIAFTNTYTPVHKFGQGVFQVGLQNLLFDLDDMHKPSPNIE
jgi:hypothetical protein